MRNFSDFLKNRLLVHTILKKLFCNFFSAQNPLFQKFEKSDSAVTKKFRKNLTIFEVENKGYDFFSSIYCAFICIHENWGENLRVRGGIFWSGFHKFWELFTNFEKMNSFLNKKCQLFYKNNLRKLRALHMKFTNKKFTSWFFYFKNAFHFISKV